VSAAVPARRSGRGLRVRSERRNRTRHSGSSHHTRYGPNRGRSGNRTRRLRTHRSRNSDLRSGLKLAHSSRGCAVTTTHCQHRQPPTAQRRATARHSRHGGSSSTTTSSGRRQDGRWSHRRRRNARSSADTTRYLHSRRRATAIAIITADFFAVVLGVVSGSRRHRSDSRISRGSPPAAARSAAWHQR
jgi:hypothetical protein